MPLGNRGHIGIKKETTWGTRVVGANDVFLPFVSEGLTRDIEDVISAIQRGVLDQPRSYQGERKCGGPLVLEVHPVSIGHILRSALGAPTGGAFADSVETEICDCETIFEHESDAVIPSLDPTIKKKGTYSSKLQVSLGAAVDTVLGSRVVAADLVGPPATTHYKFWLRCDIALDAGDLALILSELALGADGGSKDRVDIPAMAIAGQWYEHTIAIGDVTGLDTIISAGIEMLVDKGEFTLWIDDIRIVVAGTADVARKHIFTPMQTEAQEFGAGAKYTPLWPYTFEVYRDDSDDQAYEFLGCVVNTMQLSFSNTDKILKATLGIIAKSAGYVAKTGMSLETTNPFVWENAKIGIGGTAAGAPYLDMESFTLNWDNKCVEKFTLNNTAIPRRIQRAGYREIPISFTIDFVDRTEYNLFLAGTERQIQVIFEGAKVGADAANTPYTLDINFPLVRYTAFPIVNSGPGRLTVSVTAIAKYDAAGYAMLINLINDQAAAVYAG